MPQITQPPFPQVTAANAAAVLAKEWSYFFPPGGGKVVYCFLSAS